MTLKEMTELINKQGLLEVSEGFQVAVQVVDVKNNFGRVLVEVLPLRGQNTGWVLVDRVKGLK